MQKTFPEIIEILSGLALFVLGITWFFNLNAIDKRNDKFLISQTNNKPSIVHTYAYIDAERDFTSAEVLSDILENDLIIKCNNVAISADTLTKARKGNTFAIESLKNTFSNATYKKTYEYSETGEIIGLSFK